MGIGDITGRVITKYLADTSDQRREIELLIKKNHDLQTAEKNAARAREDHFNQITLGLVQSSKHTDDSAISWDGYQKKVGGAKLSHEQFMGALTKGAVVLGSVGIAVNFITDSFKEYGEHSRLVATTAGINIDKLSDSFKGLVNEHELLTFAAQTQTGVLKLNQGEMNTVAEAAVALKNRGFDLGESIKKLTDAAVKGKVGGLDDLGLSIKEGGSRAETTKNLMNALNGVIKESGTAASNSADDVQRLAKEWDDAVSAVKRYTVEALKAPNVGDMFDEAERQIARGRGDATGVGEMMRRGANGGSSANVTSGFLGGFDSANARASEERARQALAAGIGRGRQNVRDSETIEMGDDDLSDDYRALKEKRAEAQKKYDAEQEKQAIRHAEIMMKIREAWRKSVDDKNKADDFALANAGKEMTSEQIANQMGFGSLTAGTGGAALPDEDKIRKQGYLEAALGPVEQFDAYQEGFAKLGETFNAFGSAVGAGYEAIVTGQGSASAAFRKVMADGLMAIGKSSLIEALRETALGFGSLALGPLGGVSAAMHFKAAALHGAVAVAAGLAASGMGAGSQGSASGNAPASNNSAGANGGVSTGGGNGGMRKAESLRPITIIVGDAFSEDSPRMRATRAREAVDRALRERDE